MRNVTPFNSGLLWKKSVVKTAFLPVLSGVFGYVDKLKIFKAIIRLITVDVMDKFFPSKFTAKMPLHYDAMFKSIFPFRNSNNDVASGMAGPTSFPSPIARTKAFFSLLVLKSATRKNRFLTFAGAGNGTEKRSFLSVIFYEKLNRTFPAFLLNHIEMTVV